jgi:type II secretory pathway pseudopilin PulG
LLELLAGIAMIGILATLLLPVLNLEKVMNGRRARNVGATCAELSWRFMVPCSLAP